MELQFRILGPLEVRRNGEHVALDAPRQKALLGLLLIHPRQVLSSERILEEVWGDDQPASGASTLRYHISKLRDVLEPDRDKGQPGQILVTQGRGYMLQVEPDQIDAERFSAQAHEGHVLADAHPGEASQVLGDALEMWYGEALSDFRYEQFAQGEIARLEELRLRTVEDRLAADLQMGRHSQVIADLEGLVQEHPLRERIAGLLMLALYRSDRQADALRAYRDARRRLGDGLGIEPSPALSELEEGILLHDENLRALPQAPQHNLPSAASALIDRVEDRESVAELLHSRRVITLLGPGGIGKSRLALAVAETVLDDYRDGVWFVDVSGIDSAAGVVAALGDALGLSGQRTKDVGVLVDHCRARQLLLVVDGCEHLVREVGETCTMLIRACPGLRLLLTSRERLRLEGEAVWPVGPLGLPTAATAEATAGSGAGALFIDRALAASPRFRFDERIAGTVADICERLEGIPLAIEMAASRVGTLPVGELSQRLGDRLGVLARRTGGRQGRRETMRAVIDWSYDLLSAPEQAMLRRISVFHGGFTLEAAEKICGDPPPGAEEVLDLLERLVDTSFVSGGTYEDSRFRMLDILREYAAARLGESDEAATMATEHARYFAEVARIGNQELSGAEQATWLERMDQERFNLRSAVLHAAESNQEALALDLAANLGRFWFERGYHVEARSLLGSAVAAASDVPSSHLAYVLADLAVMAIWNGEMAQAEDLAHSLRKVVRELDDPGVRIRWCRFESTFAWGRGDYRRAAEMQLACLTEMRSFDPSSLAVVAGQAAGIELQLGREDTARALAAELRSCFGRYGQPEAEALIADLSGWFAFQEGDNRGAVSQWLDAELRYEELGLANHVVDTLVMAAWASIEKEDTVLAQELGRRAVAEARKSSARFFEARALALLAWADLKSGTYEAGMRLLHKGLSATYHQGDRCWVLWSLGFTLPALLHLGEVDLAARLCEFTRHLRDDIGVVPPASMAARLDAADHARQPGLGPTPPSLYAAGRSLSYDDAVALALSGLATSGT